MFGVTNPRSRRGRIGGGNTLTINQLIRRLQLAKTRWGGNTLVGAMLTGSGGFLKILDVHSSEVSQRVTVVVQFTDKEPPNDIVDKNLKL